jgi:hypothetical protein
MRLAHHPRSKSGFTLEPSAHLSISEALFTLTPMTSSIAIARRLVACLSVLTSTGCAFLHHVQVGQVDNRDDAQLAHFEIKVSETGVATEDVAAIAKATRSRAGDDAAGIAAIISLFQMGPRTGNPVYNEHYAEQVLSKIHEACPSGQVTGLMSVREMRKYPVISGEIVKISGYCRKQRKTAAADEVQSHD